jgi:hypothetical protein
VLKYLLTEYSRHEQPKRYNAITLSANLTEYIPFAKQDSASSGKAENTLLSKVLLNLCTGIITITKQRISKNLELKLRKHGI